MLQTENLPELLCGRKLGGSESKVLKWGTVALLRKESTAGAGALLGCKLGAGRHTCVFTDDSCRTF
jgi:hypothetical protein